MSEEEQKWLLEAIKINAPAWYERLKKSSALKKSLISDCIDASRNEDDGYQDQINQLLHSCQTKLNDNELILLNYVCLIRHKEHINKDLDKDDEELQRWLSILIRYSEAPAVSILEKHVRQIIKRYKIKNRVGRPKGSGKRSFVYNGKEYHTLQECADDYGGITRQGIHKKLRKLHII